MLWVVGVELGAWCETCYADELVGGGWWSWLRLWQYVLPGVEALLQ